MGFSSVNDLSRLKHKLKRGLWYILTGNWRSRLCLEQKRYGRQIRQAMWHYRSRYCDFFDYKLQPGLRIRLYTDSRLSKKIYVDNFEYEERQFVNAFLRPGDTFIDIGANIGLFTLIAAQGVGNTGKVYSFEPCTKTFQRLRANVQLNRFVNTHCYKQALSNRIDQETMYIAQDDRDALNSFSRPEMPQNFATETVQTTTIDHFFQEHNLSGKVTMIKIDVEGWETHVLMGGEKTFSCRDAPVLQIEFTDQNAQQAGTSCRELYGRLVNFGYQVYIYDEKSQTLLPEVLREKYPYLNLIAVKQPAEIYSRLS
jgi:FkbM family methyltransferase